MQMDDQLRVALQHTLCEMHRVEEVMQSNQKWNASLERDIAENTREIDELTRRLARMPESPSFGQDRTG